MSDWDLMMPGMGLTAIGMTGVVVAYSGVAKTFTTGMEALTGLTMMFGLIFLACGMLSGGIATSNKAKATTLVVLGISSSFGVYGLTVNSVSTITRFAGVLMVIIIPTIMIAYASMKIPQYFKPISIIFLLAVGVGVASYVTLGFIGPGAQFSLNPPAPVEEIKEKPVEPALSTAKVILVEILAGAAQQGNPSYKPDSVTVTKGEIIEWTNNDNTVHTVTSSADAGATFDSSLIAAGSKFDLDTAKLAAGEHAYLCTVHPFMTAKFVITEGSTQVTAKVSIPKGASTQKEGQKYFDPQEVSVKVRTTVVWSNDDDAAHTVTSGNPTAGPSEAFDSSMLPAGKTFEHKFDSAGTTEYYCQVHPWMTGKVVVG